MLLALIVFAASVIQTFFTPGKTRAILAGKRQGVGNVLAASLGIVTPFCSCSAVPLFIGFLTAGVPLGVTFSGQQRRGETRLGRPLRPGLAACARHRAEGRAVHRRRCRRECVERVGCARGRQ
ncbi:MAG: hypothetical protein B7X43_01505 [Thiomonas sp. 15-63-373]|nr:MAG: hypothetical protein B7X43_01505 [Thiomonas sp. 15-63-373]